MALKATLADEAMMRRAIALSLRGFPAPNPHVGCVIAANGEVVGEGFHDYRGGPHAEAVALGRAGARAHGAEVFVTLEPCSHHGRTPPCVNALLEAGVRRVVAATLDPVPGHGGGLKRLEDAGVEVEHGLLADEAARANWAWLQAAAKSRPFVVVKVAATLDGRIATLSGESKWITGEASRRWAHRLRAECGAVLVGRRTVELDDPQLTVRALSVKNQPVRVVLDSSRALGSERHVFDRQAPTIRVVASDPAPGEVRAVPGDGGIDLPDLMQELYALGITSLLVEGGATTIGSFFAAQLVDRLELFIAGKVLGSGLAWIDRPLSASLANAPGFEISKVRRSGNDAWITCVRKE